MWVGIRQASDTAGKILHSFEELNDWVQDLPIDFVETARVFKLDETNKVKIRFAQAYIREQDA